MQMNWVKCKGNKWCGLNSLRVDEYLFESYGVYIVWRYEPPPKIDPVFVGIGNIGEGIIESRNSYIIQRYGRAGLLVTWADILSPQARESIAMFLHNRLEPKVSNEDLLELQAKPNEVNLPWKFASRSLW